MNRHLSPYEGPKSAARESNLVSCGPAFSTSTSQLGPSCLTKEVFDGTYTFDFTPLSDSAPWEQGWPWPLCKRFFGNYGGGSIHQRTFQLCLNDPSSLILDLYRLLVQLVFLDDPPDVGSAATG